MGKGKNRETDLKGKSICGETGMKGKSREIDLKRKSIREIDLKGKRKETDLKGKSTQTDFKGKGIRETDFKNQKAGMGKGRVGKQTLITRSLEWDGEGLGNSLEKEELGNRFQELKAGMERGSVGKSREREE